MNPRQCAAILDILHVLHKHLVQIIRIEQFQKRRTQIRRGNNRICRYLVSVDQHHASCRVVLCDDLGHFAIRPDVNSEAASGLGDSLCQGAHAALYLPAGSEEAAVATGPVMQKGVGRTGLLRSPGAVIDSRDGYRTFHYIRLKPFV